MKQVGMSKRLIVDLSLRSS
jgi:23S rRNA (uridine2552-2'-O)-methyltransferase